MKTRITDLMTALRRIDGVVEVRTDGATARVARVRLTVDEEPVDVGVGATGSVWVRPMGLASTYLEPAPTDPTLLAEVVVDHARSMRAAAAPHRYAP